MCCEVTRPEAFDLYSALITLGDQDSFSGTDFNKLSAVKKNAEHGNRVLKRNIRAEGDQVVYVVFP